MKEVDQKAQRDIPDLRRKLSLLLDLVIEIMKEPLETSEKDHFRLMAFCFLGRQAEHAKTILLLVDNAREIDAQLICRSMVEGLMQLLWAANDPQTRALRWRSYTFIEVWKQIQQMKAINESVDENLLSYVNKELSDHGKLHYTMKARDKMEQNLPLPKKPFYRNWYGDNLLILAKEVEGESIYNKILRPQAAWHHWSAVSFGKITNIDNAIISLSYFSPSTTAEILSCDFLCLWQTAVLFDHHVKLNFGSRLEDMKNELIAWQKEQNKQ